MLCFKFRKTDKEFNDHEAHGEQSGCGGHDCFDPSNIFLEGPGQRKYSAQVKLKRLKDLLMHLGKQLFEQ